MKVEAGNMIGEASLTAGPSFGRQPVDQIDGAEEPAACPGADATVVQPRTNPWEKNESSGITRL